MPVPAEELHALEGLGEAERLKKLTGFADRSLIDAEQLVRLNAAAGKTGEEFRLAVDAEEAAAVVEQEAGAARALDVAEGGPPPGPPSTAPGEGGGGGALTDGSDGIATGDSVTNDVSNAAAGAKTPADAIGAAKDSVTNAKKLDEAAAKKALEELEASKGPRFYSLNDKDGKFSWGRAGRRAMFVTAVGGSIAVLTVKDDGPTCEDKCNGDKMINPDKPGLQKWNNDRQENWEEKCKGKLESAECTTYCSEDNEEGACSNKERQERAMDLVGAAAAPELNWLESLIGVPFELMGSFFLDLLEEFAPWIGLCCLICCLLIVILAWVRSKFTSGVGMGLDILDATQATTKIDKAKILLGPKKGGGNRNYTKTYFLLFFFIFIIYYEQKT
jgi:hypothetical protein